MSQSEPLSSNIVPSSRGISSSSSSASSYSGSQGSGSSSSASAVSASGKTSSSQKSVSNPNYGSTRADASATASDTGADTSANASVVTREQNNASPSTDGSDSSEEESTLSEFANSAPESSQKTPSIVSTLLLGNSENNFLVDTVKRDIFFGNEGADIFQIGAAGTTDLNQADILLDYNPEEHDLLALSGGLTTADITFDVVDFNGDGVADSTAIRSLIDNTILTVAFNTVDESGKTRLSLSDFADAGDVAAFAASGTDEGASSTNVGSNSSSASSSSFVDGAGVGSSSSSTATSSTEETSNSSANVYAPGASSSSGSATASASDQGANSSATAEVSTPTPVPPIDFLLGTAANDSLVGNENRNFFIGNQGADSFVLSATDRISVETADIVVDFSAEEGDLIQLPATLTLSDITFKAVDVDGNGSLDGTSIEAIGAGKIYAVVLNSLDVFGTTMLSSEQIS